jgi:hypothetical protein
MVVYNSTGWAAVVQQPPPTRVLTPPYLHALPNLTCNTFAGPAHALSAMHGQHNLLRAAPSYLQLPLLLTFAANLSSCKVVKQLISYDLSDPKMPSSTDCCHKHMAAAAAAAAPHTGPNCPLYYLGATNAQPVQFACSATANTSVHMPAVGPVSNLC